MNSSLRKILHVEDEPDIQEITRVALEVVGGFTLETCGSGEEAIEIVGSFKPDMTLIDVRMPGMDGPSTLRAMRAKPELQEMPIVFVTAKVLKSEINLYREMGALDVITKPFNPMTLSERIIDIWNARYA